MTKRRRRRAGGSTSPATQQAGSRAPEPRLPAGPREGAVAPAAARGAAWSRPGAERGCRGRGGKSVALPAGAPEGHSGSGGARGPGPRSPGPSAPRSRDHGPQVGTKGGGASPRDRAHATHDRRSSERAGAGRGPGSRAGGRPRAARSRSRWGRAVALCSPGAPGGVGREVARGTWSFGSPEGRGRGRRASNRSGRRALEGAEGTCVAGGGGSALGDGGEPSLARTAPPQERERGSFVCAGLQLGGGEEAPGPSPVSSPLEGPEGEAVLLIFLPAVPAGGGQWWCLAALPSLGAGGEKNLEAPPGPGLSSGSSAFW